jgi:hypothetical protein
MSKARAKSHYKLTMGDIFSGNGLFAYTLLTFFVVLCLYFATKDWKGFTAPEEVDLGVVRVPAHNCRRKHVHRHYY